LATAAAAVAEAEASAKDSGFSKAKKTKLNFSR
jgi:hypothetical protein